MRNPHYWNNAANKLDGVKYVQIADENAELRAYRAGELHCTVVVPRGQFDWIKENLAAELHVAPQLSTYYYGFNLDRPLFARNPKLRQALSMAIDRERLAHSVLRVGELPAYSWVPPGVNNYTQQSFDYATTPVAARIEAARKLLAEAGYTREKPLKFELRYNTGEVHTKVAVAVASMWKEALGVEASLAAVEFKSLFEDIDRRDVDMYRLSWVGDYNDAYTFLQYLKGDFGINLPHYSSAAYDALLDEASRQTDASKRRDAARTGRTLDARRSPVDSAVFLREQASREARGPGLVRQRHERGVFAGSRARAQDLTVVVPEQTLPRLRRVVSYTAMAGARRARIPFPPTFRRHIDFAMISSPRHPQTAGGTGVVVRNSSSSVTGGYAPGSFVPTQFQDDVDVAECALDEQLEQMQRHYAAASRAASRARFEIDLLEKRDDIPDFLDRPGQAPACRSGNPLRAPAQRDRSSRRPIGERMMRRRTVDDYRRALCAAIQARISTSSTDKGSAPIPRSWSWNARISKRAPSAFSASARSAWILS